MSKPKGMKPTPFDGTDNSLAAVNAWIFHIRAYVRGMSEDKQVETAMTFLVGTAERWFLGRWGNAEEFPPLKEFFEEFTKNFARADDAWHLRKRIESITQGTMSPIEYRAEFMIVLNEVGKHDEIWARQHFERGLSNKLQYSVVQYLTDDDTIDTITSKAQRVWEFQSLHSTSSRKPSKHSILRQYYTTPTSPSNRPNKLDEKERARMVATGGCFKCRQHGHIVRNCPENFGNAVTSDIQVKAKKEVVNAALIVESDSDEEYNDSSQCLPCSSSPVIKVNTRIQDIPVKALCKESHMELSCGKRITLSASI